MARQICLDDRAATDEEGQRLTGSLRGIDNMQTCGRSPYDLIRSRAVVGRPFGTYLFPGE